VLTAVFQSTATSTKPLRGGRSIFPSRLYFTLLFHYFQTGDRPLRVFRNNRGQISFSALYNDETCPRYVYQIQFPEHIAPKIPKLSEVLNYIEWLQREKPCIQLVSATRAEKTSAGVWKLRHFLGRSFSHCSSFFIRYGLIFSKSVFFGKKRRINPIVFSTVPRSQL